MQVQIEKAKSELQLGEIKFVRQVKGYDVHKSEKWVSVEDRGFNILTELGIRDWSNKLLPMTHMKDIMQEGLDGNDSNMGYHVKLIQAFCIFRDS